MDLKDVIPDSPLDRYLNGNKPRGERPSYG